MLSIRLGEDRDVPRLSELMSKSGVEVPGITYDVFSHLVLVAEDDDKVVGFVQCLVGKPYSHLTEMSVDPDYRGQDIGKKLLAAMEETITAAGSNAWTTCTSKDNIADALKDWGADYLGQGYGFVRILNGNC